MNGIGWQRNGLVVGVCVLIAACADAPLQPERRATSDWAALKEQVSGLRVSGRDTIYWGDTALAMIRSLAARHAADGDSALFRELSTWPWIDDRAATSLAPSGELAAYGSESGYDDAARANIPTRGWQARIIANWTEAAASGASGTVSSGVFFHGTHASNNMNYFAKAGKVDVVMPTAAPTEGMGDHVLSCLASTWALAGCGWVGTFASKAAVDFGGRACGVTLTASATHQAWFGLYITVSAGNIGFAPAGRFGMSLVTTDANDVASNGTCAPPSASFTMSAAGQTASSGSGLTVQTPDVNGISVTVTSTSSQGGAPITAYAWKIDGGAAGGGTGFTRGLSVGSHTISLTVTNSQGLSSSASGTISVEYQGGSTNPPGGDSEPTYRGEYESGDEFDDPSGGFTCNLYWHEYISYDGGDTWYDNGRKCINWSWAELRADEARVENPKVILVLTPRTPVDGRMAVIRRAKGRGSPLVVWIDEGRLSAELVGTAFTSVPLLIQHENGVASASVEYRVSADRMAARLPDSYRAWVSGIVAQLLAADASSGADFHGSRALQVELTRKP